MNRNDGISIQGGNVTAGAMAAGDHASVTISSGGGDVTIAARPDVAALLQALVTALDRHRDELPASADPEAGAELAGELAQPKPSASRVRELLAAITAGAGSVSAVSQAATALGAALRHLL